MVLTDEEQPLLRTLTEDSIKHEVVLDFEPLDPEDPRNWSDAFKWCIVLLLACMAFTVYVQLLPCLRSFPVLRCCYHFSTFFPGRSPVSSML